MTIDRETARRALLAWHSLLPPRSLASPDGARSVVRTLRCVQVDPLDVTGPNVHLVMQSRVRGFRTNDLDDLIHVSHEVVEAWDKVRSLVPAEEWPLLAPYRESIRAHHERTGTLEADVLEYVRQEVQSRGRVSSLDLEDRGTAAWRWAPAKAVRAALELLFDLGEIGIVDREAGRKIYAPMPVLLGNELATAPPHATAAEYHAWHVLKRIRAVGLAADRAGAVWLGIHDLRTPERRAAIRSLLDAGELVEIAVDGVSTPVLLPAEAATLLDAPTDVPTRMAFLAPLDNVLWDRRLVAELFDFDYTWEVYKPAVERRYGYYVLPVLLGDRLVARWEPRRVDGRLVVRGWWWERGNAPLREADAVVGAAADALAEFTGFLGVAAIGFEPGVSRRDRTLLRAAAQLAALPTVRG